MLPEPCVLSRIVHPGYKESRDFLNFIRYWCHQYPCCVLEGIHKTIVEPIKLPELRMAGQTNY